MTNPDNPRFKTPNVAEAAGISHDTMRSYFKRGQWRVIGKKSEGGSQPNLFSKRDAVAFAIAARLIKVGGLNPGTAFDIAVERFAHTGDHDRAPGELFNVNERGLTLLVYYPDTETARVIAEGDVPRLSDLLGTNRNEAEAATVIVLNYLVARVYAALGVERASDG